jgi:hypothetical protein
MKIRLKVLFILITLAVTISFMSSTYSRYVADTIGNLEVQFANWKILVNEFDITNGNTSSIELTPVMLENANVAQNKVAPSSKGYFDIVIDPSNVEVSFDYEITLDVLNENIPDLIIKQYAILDKNYDENPTKRGKEWLDIHHILEYELDDIAKRTENARNIEKLRNQSDDEILVISPAEFNDDKKREEITKTDLFFLGLSGTDNASAQRKKLLKKLNFPELISTKALLPVLNTLFDREEFVKICEDL